MTKQEILRRMREVEEELAGLWWDLKAAKKHEEDDDVFMMLQNAASATFDADCILASFCDDLEREIKHESVA